MELCSELTDKMRWAMYIKRHIEGAVEKSFSAFPAVLISGPRQVGKSTLLCNSFKNIPYITLDNPLQLLSLKQDPLEFFKMHGSPLIGEAFIRAHKIKSSQIQKRQAFLPGVYC